MNKNFVGQAFEDYSYWATHDIKIFRKINELLRSIERDGFAKGLGKPERLKYHDGWSRQITHEHRLVYEVDKKNCIHIFSCKGHYDD